MYVWLGPQAKPIAADDLHHRVMRRPGPTAAEFRMTSVGPVC